MSRRVSVLALAAATGPDTSSMSSAIRPNPSEAFFAANASPMIATVAPSAATPRVSAAAPPPERAAEPAAPAPDRAAEPAAARPAADSASPPAPRCAARRQTGVDTDGGRLGIRSFKPSKRACNSRPTASIDLNDSRDGFARFAGGVDVVGRVGRGAAAVGLTGRGSRFAGGVDAAGGDAVRD